MSFRSHHAPAAGFWLVGISSELTHEMHNSSTWLASLHVPKVRQSRAGLSRDEQGVATSAVLKTPPSLKAI
jgi:hypothetical protein